MNGVIKARQADKANEIRPFLLDTDGLAELSGSEIRSASRIAADPVPAKIKALQDELAARDRAIADHELALTAAYTDGEAAGRIAAEDEFNEDRSDALEALKDSLSTSQVDFGKALKGFETLALLVAVEAVEKLLGDGAHYREALAKLIAHQVGKIDSASIVSIDVSRDDFPDTREVAAIEKTIGGERDKLSVVDSLEAGACRIKLNVGAIEIGFGQQWGALKDLLETITNSEAAL